MSQMREDYSKGMEIKLQVIKGDTYIKLDDLIKWLKNNQDEADIIETHWLIKTFIILKNSK